ncbi:putative negative regulator of RcsB-dependent stress response [Azospirillum fermentarium]|uniref:tetratricopeptide repeat protein n=1 Tax=Azospirillum fermentarium TaxID=1233114 RepID=UPI002226D460|nr:tetratricopeptide repeat protein [Azospirillum fermentarium]MCW2246957.1 putative negative regulator of RcsB-dependent stress response [Azospirillum fermentarium]
MGNGAHERRHRGWLLAASLLLSAPLAGWAAAVEAADVPLRAFDHSSYGRMVFDWPALVDYTARVEAGRLTVTFGEPVTAPLNRAVTALSRYIVSAERGDDGRSVTFVLKQPVSMRSFRNGNSVAIDLRPDAAAVAAAGEPPALPVDAGVTGPALSGATGPAGAPTGSSAGAAEAAGVKIRVGDHPTHSRLVFDWTKTPAYTLSRDGAAVTLTFDKAAAVDLGPVRRANLRNVANIETFKTPSGGTAITFAAPPTAAVRDFLNGKSVVIDVLNAGSRAKGDDAAAPEPAPARQPPAAPAPAAPPPAAHAPAAQTPPVPAPAAPAARQTAALPPGPPAPAAPAAAPAPAAPTAERGALVFEVNGPASMALFPRAGYLYAVFDKPLPIGAGKVIGIPPEQVGGIEPVPATGGSAFRIRIGPFVWPAVERQGSTWRVVPMTNLTAPPPQELRVDPEPEFLLGARVLVRTGDAHTIVQFTDPEVGDRLHVVPLPVASQAVSQPHRYPDAEILGAFQGVAVRPIADAVTVRPVKEGVEITAAGGLHLSSPADTGPRTPPAAGPVSEGPRPSAQQQAMVPPSSQAQPKGRRLFSPEAWQRGGLENFTDSRQQLQMNIVEAADVDRPRTQLDLARFFFANGFGPETLGMLEMLQNAQPDLDGWPEFRALRGASRFLAGDLAGGRSDLMDPALIDNGEAALWRAAIDAEQRNWPQASRGFRDNFAILTKYPEPLLSRLGFLGAEAALQAGDTVTAKRILDKIEQKIGIDSEDIPALHFLRGEQLRQAGETDRAGEELKAAYNGLDRLYHAKAGLALVNLELAEGKMSPAAAVERLAGLTYVWRGDELEAAIRQRLAEVHIAAGNYAEGFNTMKENAALASDPAKAEQITQDMQRTFAELFKDGAARLPTMDALALYDQFRELTPVGAAGDEMIRQLAERLIQLDLLAKAADLLQHQVAYRLSGMDKANIGTRLASVRLLDNKPEEAIQALEMSNVPGIPPETQAERRIMRAKALAEMGKSSEAVQLLAQDDSREANLLRVDIAWRSQNWAQAATALGKIVGPPPAPNQPLKSETSQMVLNRAVAMALGGDSTGLGILRREFGAVMDKGPDSDAFRLLTRPEQAGGLMDVGAIRSRVAEVDVFQKFLKDYRGKQTNLVPPGSSGGTAPAVPGGGAAAGNRSAN